MDEQTTPPPKPAVTAPIGEADETARLQRQIRQMRNELTAVYTHRDSVGPMLRGLLASPLWRWFARPAWLYARARGHLRMGLGHLRPLFDVARQPDGTLHGQGLPQMYLTPPLPIHGWVRVRATVDASVSSKAVLYFDTGGALTQKEHFDLGAVAGLTTIDRMIPVHTPVFLMRFDPIQAIGKAHVLAFDLEPMSSLRFNWLALWTSIRKRWTDQPGPDRPHVRHGLSMLAAGQLVPAHQRLVDRFEQPPIKPDYERWRQRHAKTDADYQRMRDDIATWRDPPKFSVILPVYDVDEQYLRPCLESVRDQVYRNWEFCIVDDKSPSPHVRRILDEYAATDARFRVHYAQRNGNISVASNTALAMATGDYVAMIDHDDTMALHALYEVAKRIVADPSLDWVYTDEDKLTVDGKHFDPFFKPDFSPEYLRSCMYINHLCAYRTTLVRHLGGWRSRFDGAQDYDLALRVTNGKPRVAHVPDVLYHWRAVPNSTAAGEDNKPEARPRGRMAIQTSLEEGNQPGRVDPGPSAGFHKVRYDLLGTPKVSLVIPTAGKAIQMHGRDTSFIIECVASVRKRSTYKNYEIVVIDNDDLDPALAAALADYDVKRITYAEPFNLARKINQGVDAATGEYVVLLNDDVEVITADWIEGLLEFCQWPDVGCVGPQLLFPDDRLQHAGVTVLDGSPVHAFYQYPGDHGGYFFSSQVTRNWSAVTGACLMTRRDLYQQLGGFNPVLPLNFNDVDYCLKVGKTGRRIVCVPHVRLYHHESVSKPPADPRELDTFKGLWGEDLNRDPFYNPNLTTHSYDFALG